MNHPDAINSVYSIIAREIDENRFDKTLMTRAIAETSGDKNAAHSLYIRLRSEQLHAELEESLLNVTRDASKATPTLNSPNRPLHKYILKENCLFGAHYTVLVKERSLTISNEKMFIEITPSTEDYGIRLVKRLIDYSTLSVYGAAKSFYLELQINNSEYKQLSAWRLANKIP
jgi:hypothetical protein